MNKSSLKSNLKFTSNGCILWRVTNKWLLHLKIQICPGFFLVGEFEFLEDVVKGVVYSLCRFVCSPCLSHLHSSIPDKDIPRNMHNNKTAVKH